MYWPCNPKAAELLASRGYSSSYIRPLWYRVYRRLGIRIPIPATMNLQEHFFYGGVTDVVFLSVAFFAALELGYISRFPVILLLVLPVALQVMNWLRYRKARADLRSSFAKSSE